jgi:hypothetical protein
MVRPLLFAAALLASVPAYAGGIADDRYRIEDAATRKAAMRWERTYLILSAIDTVQTVRCFKRDASCVELNPLWPGKPSVERIIIGKLIGGAVHYAAVDFISRRNPKMAKTIAQVSVAVQGAGVVFNLRTDF